MLQPTFVNPATGMQSRTNAQVPATYAFQPRFNASFYPQISQMNADRALLRHLR
jgi:hypothetical protein